VLVDRVVVTPERVGRAFQPWHVDVQPDVGQRWKGYLQLEMTLTLRNLVVADTPLPLRQREDEFVELGLAELAVRPVEQTFDLAHLQAIHERLFGDVYPWAGETRTVNMNRPGSPSFCPWDQVEFEVAYLADHLQQRDHLAGLGRELFVDRATRVYDGINRVHAFREGNGRTQREWMSDLARGAGYRLDWTAVHGSENDQACRRAHLGDRRELTAMVDSITELATAPDTEEQRAQRFAETLRRTRAGAAPPARGISDRVLASSVDLTPVGVLGPGGVSTGLWSEGRGVGRSPAVCGAGPSGPPDRGPQQRRRPSSSPAEFGDHLAATVPGRGRGLGVAAHGGQGGAAIGGPDRRGPGHLDAAG